MSYFYVHSAAAFRPLVKQERESEREIIIKLGTLVGRMMEAKHQRHFASDSIPLRPSHEDARLHAIPSSL